MVFVDDMLAKLRAWGSGIDRSDVVVRSSSFVTVFDRSSLHVQGFLRCTNARNIIRQV